MHHIVFMASLQCSQSETSRRLSQQKNCCYSFYKIVIISISISVLLLYTCSPKSLWICVDYNVFVCLVHPLPMFSYAMSLLFGGKTISRKTQRSKYIHIIIVYVIIAMTIMKVYFRMKWSSTVWRTISSTGMVRQNNIQKSMNCRFIHYDGLEEDCWLRIRFYIFWLAPLCRPWSEDFQLYLSALLSSPASPLCWFYFLPLCWFLFFWIWFFFCFHHSRRRIKWFTRGECFCRRIIWQENCFQGRGPPLTMRLMMMMMCQKCFCLLKTS